MPLRRSIPQSRYGRRNLDPALPLVVLRRIAAGKDADGKPIVLLPGDPFDPSGIDGRRLAFLHRGRFIGHEASRAMRQGSSVKANDPPPVVEAPAEPPIAEPPPPPPGPAELAPVIEPAPAAPVPIELAPGRVEPVDRVVPPGVAPPKTTARPFVPSRFSPPPGKRRGA